MSLTPQEPPQKKSWASLCGEYHLVWRGPDCVSVHQFSPRRLVWEVLCWAGVAKRLHGDCERSRRPIYCLRQCAGFASDKERGL